MHISHIRRSSISALSSVALLSTVVLWWSDQRQNRLLVPRSKWLEQASPPSRKQPAQRPHPQPLNSTRDPRGLWSAAQSRRIQNSANLQNAIPLNMHYQSSKAMHIAVLRAMDDLATLWVNWETIRWWVASDLSKWDLVGSIACEAVEVTHSCKSANELSMQHELSKILHSISVLRWNSHFQKQESIQLDRLPSRRMHHSELDIMHALNSNQAIALGRNSHQASRTTEHKHAIMKIGQ